VVGWGWGERAGWLGWLQIAWSSLTPLPTHTPTGAQEQCVGVVSARDGAQAGAQSELPVQHLHQGAGAQAKGSSREQWRAGCGPGVLCRVPEELQVTAGVSQGCPGGDSRLLAAGDEGDSAGACCAAVGWAVGRFWVADRACTGTHSTLLTPQPPCPPQPLINTIPTTPS